MVSHDTTIIVLAKNYFDVTNGCIESILRTLSPLPKIIICDSSTDGSDIKIREKYPFVTMIRKNTLSLSEQWNLGINQAFKDGSHYICAINNDTLFNQSNWLYKLVETYEKISKDHLCGSISPMGYRITPQSSGITHGATIYRADIDYIGDYGFRWVFPPPIYTTIYPDDPITREQYEVFVSYGKMFWVDFKRLIYPTFCMYGATFLFPRETWNKVGEFDESLCFSHDETDFSFRCWEKMLPPIINRSIEVYHRGGTIRSGGLYKILVEKAKEFNVPILRPEWIFVNKHKPQESIRRWNKHMIPFLASLRIKLEPFNLEGISRGVIEV